MGRLIVFFAGFAAFAHGERVAGTISLEELNNPLTGKQLRVLETAQRDLRSGQRARGMEELSQAMADPQMMPWALSIIAVEHLKSRDFDTALPELEQAVRLLPGLAENHSNFAYALGAKGQTERGIQEAKKALQLDPSRARTRFVLGLLLMQQGSPEQAIAYMRSVADEIPEAHKIVDAYAFK